MQYLALCQRTKRETGRSGSAISSVGTAAGEDLDICRWVADAWRAIQQMPYNWRWMRQSMTPGLLAVGTCVQPPGTVGATAFDRWAPETDDYRPSYFESSTPGAEVPLVWLPYERFRGAFLVGTPTSGAPQYWSEAPSGNLLIGPPPDLATYKFRGDYFSLPTELSGDEDEPAMPEQFHMLVVWEAVKIAAGFDAAPDVWQRANDQAQRLLDTLIDRQGEKITITGRPLGLGRPAASSGFAFP